jgi:hypothetical protein
MKTSTFPNMKKITLTGLLTLLVLLFVATESYSQTIVLDGDQCLGEYGTPDTPDGDQGYSAPSEILNFWGNYQVDNGIPYVYFAFDREASGAAGFAVYIDNDCNLLNGEQTQEAIDAGRQGADIAAFFGVKSNGDINPVIIYEWDGANYVDSGNKFEAAIGSPNAAICDEFTDSTDHGQFLEIRIALADIYNISNCEVCSDLKILPSTTYASGSFNSTPQDPFEANISFDVGAPMIPSQNPWCSAETLADLDATVMGAGITRWYLDNQLVNELFPPFDKIPLANRSYWVTLTLEGSTCESDPVEVVILLDTTGPTITAPADYTIYGCDETELEDTDTELSYNFGIAGGPTDALALDKAKFLLLKGGGSALPDQSDVTYLGYYDSAVDSTNPCAKTFIRTFIAFDDCNNNTQVTQVITLK